MSWLPRDLQLLFCQPAALCLDSERRCCAHLSTAAHLGAAHLAGLMDAIPRTAGRLAGGVAVALERYRSFAHLLLNSSRQSAVSICTCLQADSLEEVAAELERRGVPFVRQTVTEGGTHVGQLVSRRGGGHGRT